MDSRLTLLPASGPFLRERRRQRKGRVFPDRWNRITTVGHLNRIPRPGSQCANRATCSSGATASPKRSVRTIRIRLPPGADHALRWLQATRATEGPKYQRHLRRKSRNKFLPRGAARGGADKMLMVETRTGPNRSPRTGDHAPGIYPCSPHSLRSPLPPSCLRSQQPRSRT